MTSGTGYAIHEFRDGDAEIERLRRQAAAVADLEEQALLEFGLPGRGRALDVGCGPGFFAERLKRIRPALEIVGVDVDRTVLGHAVRHLPGFQADATKLPFSSDSLDFAYARLMFRHLPDPQGALWELRRVIRPGAPLVVLDSDDGALVMHPEPPGFKDVLDARHAGFRRRGADPFRTRTLPRLLTLAQMVDVRVRPIVVSSAELGAEAFSAIVLSPIADAIDADLMDTPRVRRAAQEIKAWGRIQGAFGMTTALVVGARKPE